MDMKINQAFIKELRLKKSWSQEKLADKAGVSLRTIQRIESDGIASFQSRIAISEALGIEPDELGAKSPVTRNKTADLEKSVTIGKLGFSIIALLLTIIGVMSMLWFASGNTSNEGVYDDKSIAVLPFISFTPPLGKGNFSTGIHEEVLFHLGQVEGIRVVPRTSVMKYENTSKDVRNIAHELNVSSVMEGSVRFEGDRVRIIVRLVRASDNTELWSESYSRQFPGTRDSNDEMDIQSEVALDVAKSVYHILVSEKQL